MRVTGADKRGGAHQITTNETALLTSAIASITLPIIAYIASPAFRRGEGTWRLCCSTSQHSRLFCILFNACVKYEFALKLGCCELVHYLDLRSQLPVLNDDEV